jgi:branched-chain amino acid transport system ATP-binding protein
MDKMLRISKLRKEFGGIIALQGVEFSMQSNNIKAIIGPNGAGKTTIFNIISGIYPPTEGEVWFKGERIDRLKPHLIATRGISRTFQTIQIFANMSVVENVMVGCHPWTRSEFLACIFKLRKTRLEEKKIRSRALELLEFVGLREKADILASSLTFHQQRLVEMARALATEPELLLLDEPAAGLNLRETRQMGELICRIREMGVSVLLVEHDMDLVMGISEEVIVLNSGLVIAEGTPQEVQNDEKVIAAYLGEEVKC